MQEVEEGRQGRKERRNGDLVGAHMFFISLNNDNPLSFTHIRS